ncbi:MAG TPA: C1 family peptidase [Bacteroidales bacterium]|nr:C1 family peptidase [Bacteroidales bacterium]
MKKQLLTASAILALIPLSLSGQNRDKAVFRTSQPGFYQTILRDDQEMQKKETPVDRGKSFVVDLSVTSLPNKVDLYKNRQWHNPPVSQGATSTCWCFSTTSFLESEAYRINKVHVKLSEMYTVYWEYVEKARRFIRERGNSAFAEGSEANAVTRMWRTYGTVPEESYTGLPDGRKFHNHTAMFSELESYLKSMKENSSWNEESGIATVKSIMNHYLGAPPAEVTVNGQKLTPVQYLKEVVKINPDDYVDILSYSQEPFYRKVEYKVPDNWWHNADYYNVPLNEFMSALKNVVRNGFTVSIGGDVSEPGMDRMTQCAVIPDFDIPSSYINDDARQFRFTNGTTTDDHGMHLVGYLEKDGKDWYLIKDSGSGSRNNPESGEFGYYFFTEDYVKLKMMDFMVHKDAVTGLLQKFK